MYWAPTPKSRTWQGVYIDDLIISQMASRSDHASLSKHKHPVLKDSQLFSKAREAYHAHDLLVSEEKVFENEMNFKLWGGEMLGGVGVVGDSRSHRWELFIIISLI